jgi:cytochrome bd-type quinol oxidase subunit 2
MGARSQSGLQGELFGRAPLLPLAQRDPERHHQHGGHEGNCPEAEAVSHYNGTFINTTANTMKILVAIAFLLIIGSLGSALFFLMRDKGKSNRTVHALAMRVGLSVTLFLLLLGAYKMGWIQPTGLR